MTAVQERDQATLDLIWRFRQEKGLAPLLPLLKDAPARYELSDRDCCWAELCDVDTTALLAWFIQEERAWPLPQTATKPQRMQGLPPELLEPIISRALACFNLPVKGFNPLLSQARPGQCHPPHWDRQWANFVTRVHVPLITNEHCWHRFGAGERVHFEVGKAYAFNTLEMHEFANDGCDKRVHLLFEVSKA